jgi:hypothetical protein
LAIQLKKPLQRNSSGLKDGEEMPIVNIANHFFEINGNPIDPDKKGQRKNKKDNNKEKK